MTLYQAIKINYTYFDQLYRMGYKAGDERYLALYSDYMLMRAQGNKTTYIAAVLSEKYNIAERTFYNVIKRFSNNCNEDAV